MLFDPGIAEYLKRKILRLIELHFENISRYHKCRAYRIVQSHSTKDIAVLWAESPVLYLLKLRERTVA